MTPKQIEARKRLFDDFEFWAANCATIRTKDGQITKLVLNPVQKRLVARINEQMTTTGKARMVVVKARQQGLSTVISAWMYWWLSQRKAQKGLVIAHVAESTSALFDLYKRTHENVPALMRPQTKYSSRTELVFNVLDSGLRVATAGGKGIARGETLTAVHQSEVAFWPSTFAAENFNGLLQAVPDAKGTAVFLESTANGVSGVFYDMYRGAKSGTNGYELFFSAWFESVEYRDESYPQDMTLLPEEEQLVADYGLDLAQLWWRRRKIATNGADNFKQEYPATADEAFISSGRPVFNTEYVSERINDPKQPLRTMAVEERYDHETGKALPLRKLVEHPRGELKIYRERDDNEEYVIGADVGMGLRAGYKGRPSDPSVAQVLDSQLRQVAVWRGTIHPDAFADVLYALGMYYNTALLAVERNNHGLLTCVDLRDKQYPNLHLDVTEGTVELDKETLNIGVFTSEKTKPLMIDRLRALDRNKEIEINDTQTLTEMLTFVVNDAGKMEAEGGSNDDCVMSLAIATLVHDGRWTPVDVPQELYVNAI